MSSEEFSLVGFESQTQEDIRKEISKCMTQHEALLKEQNILQDAIASNQDFAQKFKARLDEKEIAAEEDHNRRSERIQKEQEKLKMGLDEQQRLREDIEKMKEEMENLDKENHFLKQQSEITTALPEKKVVFKGSTSNASQNFDVDSRIVYPMEGGTALITFEEVTVAQNILRIKTHKVPLGECAITVEAKPIQFLIPKFIEMDTQICPRRILVSNLPLKESEERLLDKLEIHFSKSKNGGGEVENIDMLHDSGTVVVTFVSDKIAMGLIDKQDHQVEFERNKKHKVKVTPFLNGEIAKLEMRDSMSLRTVQLTGIPDIMEPENLQDNLEIHFQKVSSGGGEVDAIVYNRLRDNTLAVFELDDVADETVMNINDA